MRELFLKNAYVYRGRDFAPADVLVQEGVLAAVGPDIHYPVGTQVLDLNGMALVPGFIDVHTHGGDGIDVNAAAARDLQKIGAFFRAPRNHQLAVQHFDRYRAADTVVHRPGAAGHRMPRPRRAAAGHSLGGPLLGPRIQGRHAAASASTGRCRVVPPLPRGCRGARCATSPSRRRWRACWR